MRDGSKEERMTASTATPTTTRSVGTVLEPVHDHWACQVRFFLDPATDIRAGFSDRWGAVRFLGDQFAERFQLEGALVDELRPWLAPESGARLSAARADVERTAGALMAIGGRRGVAMLTAGLVQRLLAELGRWWGQLESATAHLDQEELPPRARRLLRQLQAETVFLK